MDKIKVIKKNGIQEKFESDKIIKAVKKAAERVDCKLSENECNSIVSGVVAYLHDNFQLTNEDIVIGVYDLHPIVEQVTEIFNKKVAKSYRDYRNYKKENTKMMEQILEEVENLNTEGDRSNANADSRLITTKRFLEGSALSKASYQKFFLSKKENQANNDGYIYIHDLSQRKYTFNCCMFNMKEVFKGGFTMGSIHYNEPKTLSSAFNLLGDVILSASSQQYGGFTVPEIDKFLEPYAKLSYNKYKKEATKLLWDKKRIVLKTNYGSEIIHLNNFNSKTIYQQKNNGGTTGYSHNQYGLYDVFNSQCSGTLPDYNKNTSGNSNNVTYGIFGNSNNSTGSNEHISFEVDNIFYHEKEEKIELHYSKHYENFASGTGGVSSGSVCFTFDKPYNKDSEEMLIEFFLDKETIEKVERYALTKVREEFKQGFQGLECMLNSCANAKGDYSFVSLTFGLGTSVFEKMASEICLEVRKEGQGKPGFKKPVLFPKLIFLYDKELHSKTKISYDLFLKAIECSKKCLYPDYFNVRQVETETLRNYEKYGTPISPMGCRSIVSPFYESGNFIQQNESDLPVTVGRFNIGVVSLNLIMIYAKAKETKKDFYSVLDEYLEIIRGIHKNTREQLSKIKASSYPLAFMEGGLWNGHLQADDVIEPCLKAATASFGITGLNELQQLHNQKSLVEDGEFALEVTKYIYEKLKQYKKEDGIAYAIYGTPAESLAGKQVIQFRKKYGIIPNVSDREYLSNSFHCHVSEDISPIQKQLLEQKFWPYFSGGRIMYNRYYNDTNSNAFEMLITEAMKKGYYYGVNLAKTYCETCGNESLDTDSCPVCASTNLTKIDRVCGYLGFSKINGSTRMNDSKMAEIKERKSM